MGIADSVADFAGGLISPIVPIGPIARPAAQAVAGKVNDAAVKDERVLASTLIRQETGWRGADARTARAVMGAESHYDPHAENFCCVGLMQDNVLAHHGKFGLPDDPAAARQKIKDDPRFGLRVAYGIWKEQGWNAWDTYTNGSWKNFIGQDPLITVKKGSLTNSVGGAVGGAVDAALGPVDDIAGALLNPSTYLRLGKGAVGGMLLLGGVFALTYVVANKAAGSPVGQQAASAAVKVAKVVK